MKLSYKLISVCLALILALGSFPVYAFSFSKQNDTGMTEAQRKEALAELMDFSQRLSDMQQRHALKTDDGSSGDAFYTARIIVKTYNELDYSGALEVCEGHNDWHVVQYADGDSAREACVKYAAMSGVEYAVPDIVMHADAVPGSDTFRSWGYDANNVNAFDYNEWIYEFSGSDLDSIPTVKVAIIDSGVDKTHPFLAGRLLSGYDFANNDSNPEDDYHHGTHVSGIVVDGTLANVKIVPVKVLDAAGYAAESTVALGVEYSYLTGCQVANLSLGGDCDGFDGPNHLLMEEVINAAMDAGTVVCISAGNDSADAAGHCPANVARAVTVAAMTQEHTLPGFSNYGDFVDIMAPGINIISSYPGGKFAALSGTSMAAPHAAAAAAMVKSYSPALSADSVAQIIIEAGVDIGVENAGSGMLCVAGVYSVYQPLMLGDADVDWQLTANDALLILRYVLSLVDPGRVEVRVCDVNRDGDVTGNDALMVLRCILGLAPLPEQGG